MISTLFASIIFDLVCSGGSAPEPRVDVPVPVRNRLQIVGVPYEWERSGRSSHKNLINTNNPLDIVIVGKGLFRVLRPDGSVAYTRDGRFKRDESGLIVTANDLPVHPQVVLPANATAITVGRDGSVEVMMSGQSYPQRIGVIELVMFPNASGLTPAGRNLLIESETSGAPRVVSPETADAGALFSGYRRKSAKRSYKRSRKASHPAVDMLQTLNTLKR